MFNILKENVPKSEIYKSVQDFQIQDFTISLWYSPIAVSPYKETL
jgi:hypothetical protein